MAHPYAHHALLLPTGGGYNSETLTWVLGINAIGGSLTSAEKQMGDDLVTQINAAGYGSKIKWLAPFIGAGIACHRMPLIDRLGAGAMTNSGFVVADCTTAGGISNSTEAANLLNTGIKPETVNSNNIGLGWYERAWGAGTGAEPIGCYDTTGAGTTRCVVDMRATLQAFRHGASGNGASVSSTASSAHYYGQRSSATSRALYKDGNTTPIATNATNDSGFSGSNSNTIRVMGSRNHSGGQTYWKGRCACAYITDGTMSASDVNSFHALLGTYLITPTGR